MTPKRDVLPDQPKRPTLLEAIGGVPKEDYEAMRDLYTEENNERAKAQAVVARLLEALERYAGHRGDCSVISGAPDCDCGFDEAYMSIRAAARSRRAVDEQDSSHV